MSLFARFPNEIIQFRNGVDRARKFFFDRYGPAVYRYLVWKSGDETVAKDLTASVFLMAWQFRADMISENYLVGFLFVTAYDKCQSRRQQGRWSKTGRELSVSAELAYRILEEPEIVKAMAFTARKRALDLLPDQQRIVMHKRFIEKMTVRMIALQLQIHPQTVRNHMARAIQSLRHQLSDHEFLLAAMGLLLYRNEP